MADKTLEQLDLTTLLGGGDALYIVQNGNSRRVLLNDLAAALASLASTQNPSAPFKGALVTRDTDSPRFSANTIIPWERAVYDTGGFFDPTNPSRFVIPPGVTKVKMTCGLQLPYTSASGGYFISFKKNGGGFEGEAVSTSRQGNSGMSNNEVGCISPVIPVEPGDYLSVYASLALGYDWNVVQGGGRTYFSIEAVEFSTT